ncbi:MAG: hypothetical protein JKY60_15875 [Kordiimonadaceae bacterium]|nr:hypothetical protein [Kordiimonadaceae bacterium]
MKSLPLLLGALIAFASPGLADTVKIATFNTESETATGDTQPAKVAETFELIKGIDVWAFRRSRAKPR